MNEEKNKKLKYCLKSLKDQKNILDGINGDWIDESHYRQIEREVMGIQNEFPNLLPIFRRFDFETRMPHWTKPNYLKNSLRAYLSQAIPRIEIEVSEEEFGTPVTEKKDFDFISDPVLRNILERDYEEIQRDFLSSCWKSTIILAGSSIEAILLDTLNQDSASALSSEKAPKGKKDLSKWNLSDLINVAVDIKKVNNWQEAKG